MKKQTLKFLNIFTIIQAVTLYNTASATMLNNPMLQPTSFPSTFNDLSFSERMKVKSQGYEPFKDMDAYAELVVKGEEHYIERELALMEIERQKDEQTMSNQEYCAKYPLDSDRCKPDATTMATVISSGDRQPQTPTLTPTYTTPGTSSYSGYTIGGQTVIPQKHIHGGSCYPAAKSKVFKNTIFTTGQYEKQFPAFEKALITVFRKEGKCGTIKNDPCGYTCYGIGSKCANIDVSKITRADAERFYYERFWKKYHIYRLPDVISGDVFLASMGSGPCTAIKQFRKFLGLNQNCKIDDSVVQAAENYNGDIHNDWLDVRKAFLTRVAERRYQNKVLKGWMNSIQLKRENGCHVIPVDPLYR